MDNTTQLTGVWEGLRRNNVAEAMKHVTVETVIIAVHVVIIMVKGLFSSSMEFKPQVRWPNRRDMWKRPLIH